MCSLSKSNQPQELRLWQLGKLSAGTTHENQHSTSLSNLAQNPAQTKHCGVLLQCFAISEIYILIPSRGITTWSGRFLVLKASLFWATGTRWTEVLLQNEF